VGQASNRLIQSGILARDQVESLTEILDRFNAVGITMEIFDTLKEQIESNPIILYMKGSPSQPQCGFSAKTSQALMACGERFAYVDILSNPEVRTNLPKYANWPTFPQLWVGGELIGGCDIVVEMHENGELQGLVKNAAASSDTEEDSQ